MRVFFQNSYSIDLDLDFFCAQGAVLPLILRLPLVNAPEWLRSILDKEEGRREEEWKEEERKEVEEGFNELEEASSLKEGTS